LRAGNAFSASSNFSGGIADKSGDGGADKSGDAGADETGAGTNFGDTSGDVGGDESGDAGADTGPNFGDEPGDVGGDEPGDGDVTCDAGGESVIGRDNKILLILSTLSFTLGFISFVGSFRQ